VSEIEIWIDLQLPGFEPICTFFGRRKFENRPLIGDRISFHPGKQPPHPFDLVTGLGSLKHTSIGLEVEEVSHYTSAQDSKASFITSIRCREIVAATLDDARHVADFMKSQGFEFDPYGINKFRTD